jgi:hypothetical protein
MSGGSMDYLTYKVDEVASDLQNKNNTPLQRAFGKHLEKVAKALHDVEWVWSGDYGTGDDEEAIKDVLGDVKSEKALDILKSDALDTLGQSRTEIRPKATRIVNGKGSDITDGLTAENRAKRKLVSVNLALMCVDVAMQS